MAAVGGPVERERELAAIAAAIEGAAVGSGTVVLVQGEAGLGKTELVRQGCIRARHGGMQVLEARGGPLERDFAFGVARQLLEPVVWHAAAVQRRALLGGAAAGAVAVLGVDAPAGLRDATGFSRTLHALYWLCSNVADRAPVLVAVDDTQWADEESMRWLSYMANRVADLRVVLLVAARPGEGAAGERPFAELSLAPRVQSLRLAPLSERASATLVRRIVSPRSDGAFCSACHAASGGNPFYLRELLAETEAHGIAPTAADAERVAELGPRSIAASTLVRVGRLPAACAELARAVAVLGLDVPVHPAARLAGIDIATAQEAADWLARTAIFERGRPLNFAHPVVAAAIYSELGAGARSQAHRRAADLLATAGADAGRVAAHLLRVEPAADRVVVARLRDAAVDAQQRGAPATAATYLRRALDEAAEPPVRCAVLLELGRAELTAGDDLAIDHLVEVVGSASDPEMVVGAVAMAANALQAVNRFDDAREVIESALDRVGPAPVPEHELRLAAVRMQRASCDPAAMAEIEASMPRWLDQAREAGPVGATMLVVAALGMSVRAERVDQVPILVEAAFGSGDAIVPELADSIFPAMALCALITIDELRFAEDLIAGLLDDARARGSVIAYVSALVWRGAASARRGQLRPAEADERTAAELADQHGLRFLAPWALAFRAGALLDRGALQAAADAADALVLADAEAPSVRGYMLDARGRIRLAQRRREDGIADLRTGGACHESLGGTNPNATHWRSSVALALGRDNPEAHRLASHELEAARRAGHPRAIGVALRAAGLLRGGADGIDQLRTSAAILAGSPATLEHARALLSLGAELRRQGRRVECRASLREALALADRLGADALAENAAVELAATGARPRRRQLTGVDALTPTERRIATMAAGGLGNKEIAQALFVSRKTVEMHLGHAYRKLDIESRTELTAALAGAQLAKT